MCIRDRFYVAPQMAKDIVDVYLNAHLGSGYEWWHNFYEFHKLAIDELEAFDYEEYKKNGFKVKKPVSYTHLSVLQNFIKVDV